MTFVLVFAAVTAIVALAMVVVLAKEVLAKDPGTPQMQEISHLVQQGARAFLKREYIWVAAFVIVIAVLFCFVPARFQLGWQTALAFVFGVVVSATAGYIGMSIATKANCRTTQGAISGGLKGALNVAVSGGAVMGLSVVGLALLGLVIVYKLSEGEPWIVNGYAMGASLMALFARSGGGIYTKGADMGADLVGKIEAGIPEDDPRNPAVIADNVGDNVGDVAGLGADLLESYVEAIIASLAIAASPMLVIGSASSGLLAIPFLVAGVGILASVAGVYYVKKYGSNNPQGSLLGGTYVSAFIALIGSFIVVLAAGTSWTADGVEYGKLGPFWATIIGIVSGVIIGFISEYFTSGKYKPVRNLAENSQSGAAITVTEGIAVGMESTAIPVLVLAIAVIGAFHVAGFYGVAMAALGMLATTGMVVTVDSYGPIADNAGGIAEMAGLDPSVRKITDNLDAVGNTTAAIGKGFAIGSAAFAALGLLSAYLVSANVNPADTSLVQPKVLAGLLLGGMLPFYFSSKLFRAVSYAAFRMIAEVRRQMREIPGLMEGTAKPDSARCVDISTEGAIRGMLLPGTIAIVVPVLVGLTLGKECLAGLLVGSLVSGLMLGIQNANSGGAMDNAKKYIEEGHFGGKGSETHKAAVVGDTVGDPMKDTVGPSINILIKLMAVISLVIAPLLR
ncbi:MAG: sodium-translocating pyrophosphatase [bacterium]